MVRILLDKRQSNLNPNLCNACEKFAIENQGGAEIELSLLFADVRGSTTLAEKMSALQFSQLINRFYNSVTNVLIHSDALIDRLVGDQVIGLFVPGFAGSEHAQRAIKAAQDIMVATGHGKPSRPDPVGDWGSHRISFCWSGRLKGRHDRHNRIG